MKIWGLQNTKSNEHGFGFCQVGNSKPNEHGSNAKSSFKV
jgi:hypothetical protein